MIFDHSYPFVGFEPGRQSLKIAVLKGTTVSHLVFKERDEAAAGMSLPADGFWISGMSGADVLARPLKLQLQKQKDVDSVLAFEAEPLLPYPGDQAVIDKCIIQSNEDGTSLTLLATRKDLLAAHLEGCHSLGIEPEVVSSTPLALAHVSPCLSPDPQPRILINLGSDAVTCALVESGKLLASLEWGSGMSAFTGALSPDWTEAWEELLNPSLDLAGSEKLERQQSALERWLHQAIHSLRKNLRRAEMPRLVFLGEGAVAPAIRSRLAELFSESLLPIEVNGIAGVERDELIRFAVPIGLALGGEERGNFRQGEFSHPSPWKRLKKPLTAFTGLSLALAVLLFLIGGVLVSHREAGLLKNYSALLETLELSAPATENEYRLSRGLPAAGPHAPESWTALEVQDRISFLESKFDSQPRSFPLQANVPRVSDFLAWLSSHPNVIRSDPDTGEPKAILELVGLNYTLVKRPQKSQVHERYQVKVDLEIAADNSRDAREFHDALLEPNPMVDSKQQVNWVAAKEGRYRASFMLKSGSPGGRK